MAYKILAIDDHPETLDIVVATLREGGYDVTGSQSPVRALALAEKLQPDLVLVDMSMPEMDGKEVCRRLRAHPKLADVPIIMFTAEAEAYQKLAGFEAGADDYLTKPTEPTEMLLRIETMLTSVGKPPEQADRSPAGPAAVAADLAEEPTNFAHAADNGTAALPDMETLIVLLGSRGGAGTTTAAINTAVAIAQTGAPTILVDMDMIQGHIALYLNEANPAGGLNALAQLPSLTHKGQLAKFLVPYSSQLQLLLTKPNLDAQRPMITAVQAEAILEQLMQPGHYVIVDLGLGFSHEAARPFLNRADQVIVCLRPERISLSAAKLLLHQLASVIFPPTTLGALAINYSGGPLLPLDAMQNYLGHPLLGSINLDLKEMARAINKGIPLIQLAPDSDTAESIRQITQKLINVKSPAA